MPAKPIVGDSYATWGTDLNAYLDVAHNLDGTLKISSLITGGATGTPGSVVFFGSTGLLAQDNANLFWDATNHRLGIGTNAPFQALQVTGIGQFSAGVVSPNVINPANGTLGYTIQTSSGIILVRVDSTNNRVGIGVNTGPTNMFPPTNTLTVAQASGGSGASGSDGTGGVRVAYSSGFGVSLDAWDGGIPRWGIIKYNSTTPTVVMEGRYDINGVGMGVQPAHRLQLADNDAFLASSTVWQSISDQRTKENVVPYTAGLEVIKTLDPVEFDYNGAFGTSRGTHSIGLIAQAHVGAAPELFPVHDLPIDPLRSIPGGRTQPIYSHSPHALFYMLINAVKELDTRLAVQEAKP